MKKILTILLPLLAACGGAAEDRSAEVRPAREIRSTVETTKAPGYIRNALEIVGEKDWSQMKTVTVELTEFSFSPSDLLFEAGQPYKLEIKGIGQEKHYFAAPEFFKAIATRKVQSNSDGEIKAPYFTAIEVYPEGQLDLYFVPVTPGEYGVVCTIAGHEESGMVGSLTIAVKK